MHITSGTTLGPIGITPLELTIEDQILLHNFVICAKMKQPLILGLNLSQIYRIGIDWDMYRTLFLRHESKNQKINESLCGTHYCSS